MVGTAVVTCSGGQSASGAPFVYIDGELTVLPAQLTATVRGHYTYAGVRRENPDGAPHDLGFDLTHLTGLVNGDTRSAITVSPDLNCQMAEPLLPAGTWTNDLSTQPGQDVAGPHQPAVACSGIDGDNYDVNYVDGGVVVAPAPLSVTVKGSWQYGGNGVGETFGDPTGWVDGASHDLTPVDNLCSVNGSFSPRTPVGTYGPGAVNTASCNIYPTPPANTYYTIDDVNRDADVVIRGRERSSNYTFRYVDTGWQVYPRALPIAVEGTSSYGGKPTYTWSATDFADGDTKSVVSGTLSCTAAVTPTTPAGSSVPITSCTGLTASNYDLQYQLGNVTVGKGALTVHASDGSMTYGGAAPAITPTYTGLAPVTRRPT